MRSAAPDSDVVEKYQFIISLLVIRTPAGRYWMASSSPTLRFVWLGDSNFEWSPRLTIANLSSFGTVGSSALLHGDGHGALYSGDFLQRMSVPLPALAPRNGHTFVRSALSVSIHIDMRPDSCDISAYVRCG